MSPQEMLRRTSIALTGGLEIAASKSAMRVYTTIAPALVAIVGLSVAPEVRQLWVAAMLIGAVPMGLAAHFVER